MASTPRLAVLLGDLPDVAGRVLSFDANALAIGGHTVHDDGVFILEGRTRYKDDQLQGITNIAADGEDRQISNVLCNKLMGHFTGFGLEKRRLFVYGDRVADRADLQRYVKTRAGCGLNGDARPNIFLEARSRYGDCIVTGRDRDDIVSGARRASETPRLYRCS